MLGTEERERPTIPSSFVQISSPERCRNTIFRNRKGSASNLVGCEEDEKPLLGGPRFKVIWDHKPLKYMFAKKTGKVPPRVEKFIMDLQEYDFIVEYQSGKTMIADFM